MRLRATAKPTPPEQEGARKDKDRAEDGAVVENAILLATFQDCKSPELPVRDRDVRRGGSTRVQQTSVDDLKSSESDIPEDGTADPPSSSRLNEEPSFTQSDTERNTSHQEEVRIRTRELGALESSITLRSRYITQYIKLKFESPPMSHTDPPTELERQHRDSAALLNHRTWVSVELHGLRSLPSVKDKQAHKHLEILIRKFDKELSRLDDIVQKAWEKEMAASGIIGMVDENVVPPIRVLPPDMFDATNPPIPHFVVASLLLVTILHSIASVARPYAQFILATLQVLLFGALSYCTNPIAKAILDASQRALVGDVPLDVRAALSTLHLEPSLVIYAACPDCSATYPPDPSKRDDPYPHSCTLRETDKPICGANLVYSVQLAADAKGPARVAYRAIKPYPFYPLKVYLARLLLQLGVEDMLETAWDRPPAPGGEESWEDIMDAPALQEFLGPDGKTYFSVQAHGSLHLVFSLFIDWFNPYGNKQAGKSHSIGAMYLIPLNLPPHLRFRPEYAYLAGIIPGPKEPSLEQINHLLRPLVDELLEFWHVGVFFARTAKRESGRLVRAAIVPLVCDLPALRKVAGFAHYSSHHFCSMCPLTKDQISNVERSTWPKKRSWEDHLSSATAWRDAPTERERKNIFDREGVRWSELLRLSYWDPTKYALVDTMHNLFLGELRHHCMEVWGMADVGEKSPMALAIHTPDLQEKYLKGVFRALLEKSRRQLGRFRKDYLLAVAKYNNLLLPSKEPVKREIVDTFMNWVKPLSEEHIASFLRIPPALLRPTSPQGYHLPGEEDHSPDRQSPLMSRVLKELRRTITEAIVPSWIEKPPSNLGSAAHGKLKADQWRTLCTIHMVLALVRLWGCATATAEEREALDNFVRLVVAVDIGTRRSMTPARAKLFDENMEHYLKGLRSIYNHRLVPNHHMSLHLQECLLLFGPVHGWWAFPFERYNGLLQGLNTNNKPRDMPKTFIRYFYIGSNLRWLMSTISWPNSDVYKRWLGAFHSAFKDATRGTRYTDVLTSLSKPEDSFVYDPKLATILPRDVYDQLLALIASGTSSKGGFISAYGQTSGLQSSLPTNGQFVPSVTKAGIKFAAWHSSSRNSYVLFSVPDIATSQRASRAGRIERIFFHSRKEGWKQTVEPFVVINEFEPLLPHHSTHDPFSAFPDLETRLYYNRFKPTCRVIRLTDVISHFAVLVCTPQEVGEECIIARSLDRS